MEPIEKIVHMDDRDAAFMRLAKLYLSADENTRSEIRMSWDYGVKWVFQNPFRNACSIGEKYTPKDKILASLVYDSIENSNTEREHIVGNAIDYHSCLFANLDPNELFRLVAAASTPMVAERLISFIERPDKLKSLTAFCLTPQKDNNGEWEIPWPM